MMFGENNKNYTICSNCIMDTSDPTLTFDKNEHCHFCQNFKFNIKPNWYPNEIGIKKIQPLIKKIKKEGKNKEHDCIIGISGGLDSSFAAYVAKEKFGLRPLLFHCDTGWNSDLGVSNIQKIVEELDLDLYTEVVNWEQMKNLQLAFFKSQVPFVDMAQDAVLFSAMYKYAYKNKFKYVITGGNNSTECIRECLDWTYFSTDLTHLYDIFKKFGHGKIDQLPLCDIFEYRVKYRFLRGMQVIKILDSYPFKKNEAEKELNNKFGWTPYEQKHFESRFTRFYESFWTPKKFGFDKRRAYFSSLILTNQMTRAEALTKISKPTLSETEMEKDFNFVAKKLDLTPEELKKIFDEPNKSFRDYKNKLTIIQFFTKIFNFLKLDNRIFR